QLMALRRGVRYLTFCAGQPDRKQVGTAFRVLRLILIFRSIGPQAHPPHPLPRWGNDYFDESLRTEAPIAIFAALHGDAGEIADLDIPVTFRAPPHNTAVDNRQLLVLLLPCVGQST